MNLSSLNSGSTSAQPFLEDHADSLSIQLRRLHDLRGELQQIRDRLFGPVLQAQQGLAKPEEVPSSMTHRLRGLTTHIDTVITECQELTSELGRF